MHVLHERNVGNKNSYGYGYDRMHKKPMFCAVVLLLCGFSFTAALAGLNNQIFFLS